VSWLGFGRYRYRMNAYNDHGFRPRQSGTVSVPSNQVPGQCNGDENVYMFGLFVSDNDYKMFSRGK
jgi:hypothetical protein